MAIMPLTSVAALLDALRQTQLLEQGQLLEISLPAQLRFAEPPEPFAQLLVERGWLTPYQKERLLEGRGAELVLGQYVLLDRLAIGGMGHVFTARHRKLGRIDALKIIRREYLDDPETVLRFQREAQAAARLSHPNIVIIYDAAEIGGVHYLAMEYVEGTDLARLVQEQGKLEIAEACDYIRQAAQGLQHAHEKRLVHRDVKPANLLLARNGLLKVLDLGLARLQQPSADDDDEKGTDVLTRVGSTMGTLDYQAPEQANDPHAVDARADVYSLGCTFYHLLTGRPPFAEAPPMQKLLCHQSQEPVRAEELRPDLPPGLGDVLRKMMAKAPADRYQSAAAVAEALVPYLQDELATTNEFVNVPPPRPPDVEDTDDAVETRADENRPLLWHLRQALRPYHRILAASLLLGAGLLAAGAVLLAFIPTTPTTPGKKSGDDSGAGGRPGPDSAKAGTPAKEGAGQPVALEERFTNSLGMEFVRINPGTFRMGSPEIEPGRPAQGVTDDEVEHEVILTKPYYLATCPVAQEQFEAILRYNPSKFPRKGGYPVENVDYNGALIFCDQLSQRPEEAAAGRKYRLPTEAEWEYACRAGKQTAYSFGDDPGQLGNYAWYKKNSGDRPQPVGKKEPNRWGLYDMLGNVREWCLDYYSEFYGREDPARWDKRDPCVRNPAFYQYRVIRGGDFRAEAADCRAARRGGMAPGNALPTVGFRVACELSMTR
jgi:serine/threonine protein kinase